MSDRHSTNIRQELEHMIVTGQFSNGERLDEVKLSEQFNVSRTPLREALQGLAASGLLTLIPRRGAFIHHPSVVEMVEMFEVMAELEALCGRLATRRINSNTLNKIKSAIESCQNALENGNSNNYYWKNKKLHHLIYRASGNEFLAQEAIRLHTRLQPFRRMQLQVRGRMIQSMEEHHKIFNALESADPELVAIELRNHVAIQGEKFNDLMASYKSENKVLKIK